MNVRQYIESGILELYVMQTLSEVEAREVERMAEQYPEIQKEIEQIEDSMLDYAQAHAMEPRASLKEEIFAQVSDMDSTIKPKTSNLLNIFLITALALVSAYAIFASLRWNAVNEDKQALIDARLALEQSCDSVQQQLNLLLDPQTRLIKLEGTPKSEASKVFAFWNPQTQSTFLKIESLPPPPPGKQYQLWSLVDGVDPIPAGLLNDGQFQMMPPVADADQFAISLEPLGGSKQPTLEEIYVIGTI